MPHITMRRSRRGLALSSEIRSFAPTIPAGTAIDAGWSQDMTFPARNVDGVDIRVPPGPRGEVGFYIGSAGTSIIPANSGEWIVTDNELLSFDLEDQITSGGWAFYAYNLGRLSHTVYVRFRLSLPYGPGNSPGPSLIVPSALTFGAL